MKKLLLGLMLLLVSGAASAEWMYAGETEHHTFYVDRATIRKNGNFVKMWSLVDYKKAEVFGGKAFLSRRTQEEFECKEEKMRLLAITTFSGQMLSGTVNYTDNKTEEWMAVPPGSGAEALWKIACGKE